MGELVKKISEEIKLKEDLNARKAAADLSKTAFRAGKITFDDAFEIVCKYLEFLLQIGKEYSDIDEERGLRTDLTSSNQLDEVTSKQEYISESGLSEGYVKLLAELSGFDDEFERYKTECYHKKIWPGIKDFFNRIKKLKHQDDNQDLKIIENPGDFINEYGKNIFINSRNFNGTSYDEHIIENYDKFPTITTQSRFFHKKNMREFSLREYADVQDFPEDFKFIGTYQSIRKQIGNAVDPIMGEYITKNCKGKTVGELFAGCGGFAKGIHKNNKEILWAIEWDKEAALSYKMNFPNTEVYCINIKYFDPNELEKVDIIIGGPPCQGFSNAKGYRFKDDPRNELYKEFLRYVNVLRPAEFIMENVPQIQEIKDQIISDFENINYSVETEYVNGNRIGMRQDRKRFFFKGIRL